MQVAMAPGAILIVRTRMGGATATRVEGARAEQDQWSIQYPWGSEVAHGIAEWVVPHIRKRLAEQHAVKARWH